MLDWRGSAAFFSREPACNWQTFAFVLQFNDEFCRKMLIFSNFLRISAKTTPSLKNMPTADPCWVKFWPKRHLFRERDTHTVQMLCTHAPGEVTRSSHAEKVHLGAEICCQDTHRKWMKQQRSHGRNTSKILSLITKDVLERFKMPNAQFAHLRLTPLQHLLFINQSQRASDPQVMIISFVRIFLKETLSIKK